MSGSTFGLEIAFGLDQNLYGLKQRVPHAQNYVDLGLEPYGKNFADRLLVVMHRAVRIHFDVSGMVMLNTPDGVLYGPKELNPLGSTNWELRTIWDDPALMTKTVFYLDDRIVSADEVRSIP
jgi:hypothetical protein